MKPSKDIEMLLRDLFALGLHDAEGASQEFLRLCREGYSVDLHKRVALARQGFSRGPRTPTPPPGADRCALPPTSERT